MKIIKRNGSLMEFDAMKITNAVSKAAAEVGGVNVPKFAQHITEIVVSKINDLANEQLNVEGLQDLVISALSEEPDIMNAYALYRSQHAVKRMYSLDDAIQKLENRDADLIHANANKNADQFNAFRDMTAGEVAKAYFYRNYPRAVVDAHDDGFIHVHDTDFANQPYTNCCLLDLRTLWTQPSFRLGNAEIEPPHSLDTAVAQITNIILGVCALQYGGISVDSKFDELLEPFAEYNYQKNMDVIGDEEVAKKFTVGQIKKAMKSLEYEINSLHSSVGQTPFVSIGFGLGTSFWAREIQKAILETRLEGLGLKHSTAIFPKLLFAIKDGVNKKPEDPNHDIKELAIECSAKRMYPDYLNVDKMIEMDGFYRAPMGCRSFLQEWHDPETDELVSNGRANAGVVTLNLPMIAKEAVDFKAEHGGELDDHFFVLLTHYADLAKKALDFRYNFVINNAKPYSAPLLYQSGLWGKVLSDDDNVKVMFENKRGTLSLGYAGIHETVFLLTGKEEWQRDADKREIGIRIVKALDSYTKMWNEKEPNMPYYSVYGTPLEATTQKFANKYKAMFGEDDICRKGFITNSFHWDVEQRPNWTEKIDFESEYLPYTGGGQIDYVEAPQMINNLKAYETAVDYASEKVKYFNLNAAIDWCDECGFRGEIVPQRVSVCPSCGCTDRRKLHVYKRLCGYLGEVVQRPVVEGRRKEIAARKKHI
jgi:ribonucleoside-triphosphate reductase